jgi:Domain of unknown function (DUF3331)
MMTPRVSPKAPTLHAPLCRLPPRRALASFRCVAAGAEVNRRSTSLQAILSARIEPNKGFDVNGTGTGSNFAATHKRTATRNRRLKVDAAQRHDATERVFSSSGDALPPPAAPALASTLTPARLADPWAFVIATLEDSAEPVPSEASASEATVKEANQDAAQEPRQSAPRCGRDCTGHARRSAAADRARAPAAIAKSAVVTFVERFSAKSVSITWRDSTAANYCEQLWIRRIARSQGVCAITGNSIVRGDAVYGPAGRTAARPANAAQMVLAEAIEDLEGPA